MNRIILSVWIALLDGLLVHKSLFTNSKWLSPHYEELEKVRNALVLALLVQPGKDPILDDLREDALSYDVEHDASHRAFRALLDAMELHFTGKEKEAIAKLRTIMYPDGLTFTQQSFRSQVGHAELFAERLNEPDAQPGLAVLAIELKSPETWTSRCLEANNKMTSAVAAVDQRIAELTGLKEQHEVTSVADARNAVFKRFTLFFNAINDAYPEGTKEHEQLIGPYLKELEKAKSSPKKEGSAG